MCFSSLQIVVFGFLFMLNNSMRSYFCKKLPRLSCVIICQFLNAAIVVTCLNNIEKYVPHSYKGNLHLGQWLLLIDMAINAIFLKGMSTLRNYYTERLEVNFPQRYFKV